MSGVQIFTLTLPVFAVPPTPANNTAKLHEFKFICLTSEKGKQETYPMLDRYIVCAQYDSRLLRMVNMRGSRG